MDFVGIGFAEIIFVLVIALLVIGPRRLPEIGGMLGKAVRRLKMATTELTRTINEEVDSEMKEVREDIQEITSETSAEIKSLREDTINDVPPLRDTSTNDQKRQETEASNGNRSKSDENKT